MNIAEFLEQLKVSDERLEHTVPLLQERNFIEDATSGYDLRKLQLLKRDVELFISDEKRAIQDQNEEIKKKSNDEYFLRDYNFWDNKYKEALNRLTEIEKLRLRVIQKWIRIDRISSDELELRDQFRDNIIDVISNKQARDRLVPAKGLLTPRIRRLKRLKLDIEYRIKKIQSDSSEQEKEFPAPKKVAEKFLDRDKNKNPIYGIDEIAPVMKVARDYIIREEIKTTFGCLNTIVKEAKHLVDCDPKTIGNWIKFYAEKAGIKTTK